MSAEAMRLAAALERLANEAEKSLDYRPEFRRALADAFTALAIVNATEEEAA